MRASALFLLLLLPSSHPQVILPSSSFSSCLIRPPSCTLSCPYGFIPSTDGVNCLCLCRLHPCQALTCTSPSVCLVTDGVARCIGSRLDVNSTDHQKSFIPAGAVPIRPIQDSRELSTPRSFNASLAVQSSAPRSFPISGDRPGQCPLSSIDCSSRDLRQCLQDGDCPQTYKCCPSRCGDQRLCLPPSRSTTCVHFASALLRIPNGRLNKILVPTCDVNGNFEETQCDDSTCWCVSADFGKPRPGSRQAISIIRGPDPCHVRPALCLTRCTNECPFGHEMDIAGCPLPNCECTDPCRTIKCPHEGDSCQLVEPECAEPPCRPVPRCLLNPCPSGSPMVLLTGVTALCTQSEQCSPAHFCHLVGYNGLGFCCSRPLSASTASLVKSGNCPARRPVPREICRRECSLDTECPSGKCCFDGCAMRCITSEFAPNVQNQHRPAETVRHNKRVLSSSSSSCPSSSISLATLSSSSCTSQCSSHSDCSGLRLCCEKGCEKKCVYPAATTPCLHDAITAETHSLIVQRKCEANGLYALHQCDESGCFCVDEKTGEEKAGTRTIYGEQPKCDVHRCPPLTCTLSCSSGFELSSTGCPSCKCRDPCRDINCPKGMLCSLFPVECLSTEDNDAAFCPPQPRCVPNFCPMGEPLTSSSGSPKICSESRECEPLHFCHHIGLSSGGICCRLPVPLTHSGQCPALPPTLPSPQRCAIKCTSDEDCSSPREKCCYDGCGTTCKVVSATSSRISVVVEPSTSTSTSTSTTTTTFAPRRISNEKNGGVCPRIDQEKECIEPPGVSSCSSDSDCEGVQKCCSLCSSSSRFCLFPSTATACIHLKATFERSGMKNNVKCSPNGNFEQIQCDAYSCWCVDQTSGVEREGTRTRRGNIPNCQHRRLCPQPSCPSLPSCLYGRELDDNGCETCGCKSPCKDFDCPEGSYCSSHPVDCLGATCPPVPRCLLNPCPVGIPSLDTRSLRPFDCSSTSDCSRSLIPSYCRVFRSSGTGHCCPTPETSVHSGSCPRLSSSSFLVLSLPLSSCDRQCQFDDQCASGEKCCEMGCSLVCLPAVSGGVENGMTNITPPSSPGNTKIGICPSSNILKSTACTIDCESDDDCIGFHKCCQQGCARKCMPPSMTTLCLHKLLSYEDEVNRFVLRPKVTTTTTNPFMKTAVAAVPRPPPPPVQCSPDGFFRMHQCDQRANQCWCVDPSTGKEIMGTRSSSFGPLPNCEVPRICSVSCSSSSCPHGLAVDANGCPKDGKCECLAPCTSHSCLVDGDVCILKKIDCLDEGNCHPIPVCVPSPCSSPSFLPEIDRSSGGVRQCEEDGDCSGRCFAVSISERDEQSQTRGVCCISPTDSSLAIKPSVSSPSFTPSPSPSLSSPIIARPFCPSTGGLTGVGTDCFSTCSSDVDCEGALRCCEVNSCSRRCVQPVRTTNCLNVRKSLDAMKKQGATMGLSMPQCDLITGQFGSIQCSHTHCWCVDTLTGAETPGTRIRGLGTAVICAVPRACATTCSPLSCPHSSLLLDSSGCPLADCRCEQTCRNVICPSSMTCVVRKTSCSQQICIPVASCEPNPCGTENPSKDSNGAHVECSPSLSLCPPESECRVEGSRRGLCCPSNGNITERTSTDVDGDMLDSSLLTNSVLNSLLTSASSSICPHGNPLKEEKEELLCSPDDHTCPATHYCLISKKSEGVCCPDKNFVCNQHVDEGSCSKNTNRFHFNPLLRECRPFVFGGCEGNLNNFESELQCQRFCHGVGPIEVMSASMHDDDSIPGSEQSFEIQFSLSGPKIEQKDRVTRSLINYLTDHFSLDRSELKEVSIREEDNLVRLLVRSHDAVIKTDRIAKEISSGTLSFSSGSSSYRADPHSFSSRQLAMDRPKSVGTTATGSKLLYWGILLISILVALLVFTSIICVCAYSCCRGRETVAPRAFRGAPSTDVSSAGSDRGRDMGTHDRRTPQGLLIQHHQPTSVVRVPNKGLPRHNSTPSLEREPPTLYY